MQNCDAVANAFTKALNSVLGSVSPYQGCTTSIGAGAGYWSQCGELNFQSYSWLYKHPEQEQLAKDVFLAVRELLQLCDILCTAIVYCLFTIKIIVAHHSGSVEFFCPKCGQQQQSLVL